MASYQYETCEKQITEQHTNQFAMYRLQLVSLFKPDIQSWLKYRVTNNNDKNNRIDNWIKIAVKYLKQHNSKIVDTFKTRWRMLLTDVECRRTNGNFLVLQH